MSFFEELKRRNVFKVGVAYIVAAWLLMQLTEVLVGLLGLPEAAGKFIVLLLMIGFIPAIIFAWAFEMTPEGLKREKEIDRSQSITRQTGRKLDYTIIGMLVLVAGYFIWESRFSERLNEQTATDVAQSAAEPAEPVADANSSDNSIAVLPFADMSQDKDQEYFTDGLSEELLNLLAKIPELRVAARTSSFQFKDQTGDIADIAKQLKVENILEGSVRKAGNRVRITAQLIKAENGYHLWSETWDRTLDDVFAIQDEISAAVVDALKITLLGEAPKVTETNPEAYALYLRGKFLFNQRTPEAWLKAEEAFEKSIEIDPSYAAAWAGLSEVQNFRAGFGQTDLDAGMKSALQSVGKALELDPQLGLGWANLAVLHSIYEWDYDAAGDAIRKALELEPNNATVLYKAGDQAKFVGRFDEAEDFYRKAIGLDPVNTFLYNAIQGTLVVANRLDEAEEYARDLINLNFQSSASHANLSYIMMVRGQLEEALAEIELETDDIWRDYGLVHVHHAMGNHQEADRILARFITANQEAWAFQVADLYAFRGESDLAFDWLERALQQRDPGFSWILSDIDLRSLHDDPRWEPLLEQVGLLDAWHAMPEKFK
jgi:TolB-like protein/Tfp pilus assembly protein PilF